MQIVTRGNSDRKPDLFLSHNSRDKAVVVRLAIDLTYLGIDVWLDEWELGPGDKLHLKIGRALQHSNNVAVVMSDHFMNSQWCIDELSEALALEKANNTNRVLPLLTEGGSPPPFLRDRIYVSLAEIDRWKNVVRIAAYIHGYSPKRVSDVLRDVELRTATHAYAKVRELGWNGSVVIGHDEFQEWLTHLNISEIPESDDFEYRFTEDELKRLSRTELFQKTYRIDESGPRHAAPPISNIAELRTLMHELISSAAGCTITEADGDSNLFDVGMTSLSLMRLQIDVERSIGCDIRVNEFFGVSINQLVDNLYKTLETESSNEANNKAVNRSTHLHGN